MRQPEGPTPALPLRPTLYRPPGQQYAPTSVHFHSGLAGKNHTSELHSRTESEELLLGVGIFNVIEDKREEHDLSASQPERLAAMLKEFRAMGATDCWRTDPTHGCQEYMTAEQEKALNEQTQRTLWSAPIGHAPNGWVAPSTDPARP